MFLFKELACGKRLMTRVLLCVAELHSFYAVEIIGDFPEPEARAYFDKKLRQAAASEALVSPMPEHLSDAEWARV